MSKITVVGAGNVGATAANVLAHKDIVNEVVLLDIKDDFAKGKALDSWQQAPIDYYSTKITGTSDYRATKGSDIVIVTAGIPRKPGMSRDDLISTNAKIVVSVAQSILKYTKNPIFIIVSNPLDVMAYATLMATGLDPKRVIGMAGILDTARYRAFLSTELGVSPKDIQAVLMGGHGDTMVPLPRFTTVAGIPVTDMITKSTLNQIVKRTKKGGGELVKLMGTSAWYAPGAAAAQMAESIIKDDGRIFPCSVWLEGEYGLKNIFLGVPVQLGKEGIKRILKLKLNVQEKKLLKTSAKHVNEVITSFKKMKLIPKSPAKKTSTRSKKK